MTNDLSVVRGQSEVASPGVACSVLREDSSAARPSFAKALEGRDAATRDGEIWWRRYQKEVYLDHTTGILVLHWARQIGKSFTLAAWAVDRLMSRPGRLVTVLSNSRENGAEFVAKCAEICRLSHTKHQTRDRSASAAFKDLRMEVRIRVEGKIGRIKVLAANPRTARGFSGDLILDEFAFHEDAEAIWAAAEPILASNPDFLCRIASTGNGRHNLFYRMVSSTADERRWTQIENGEVNHKENKDLKDGETELTTDGTGSTRMGNEEAPSVQHPSSREHRTFNAEHSVSNETTADGEKGEKILTADGTGWTQIENGNHLSPSLSPASGGEGGNQGSTEFRPTEKFRSREGFWVSRVTRTMAWRMGVQIYDAQTRTPITPEEARAQALDKRAYDQNYECAFADENLSLLSHELISAAEDDAAGIICEGDWSQAALDNMREAKDDLYVGFDVGRKMDLSVITVLEKVCSTFYVRGILRIRDMRLPDQELRLGEICRLPKFRAAAIDMTGLGLGLYEYARKSFGSRIRGINFASVVPVTKAIEQEGRKRETARVTETMAVELLRCYEDRRMRHPRDGKLRDDLRKPEKVTSPGGRVSISATRDEAGHADHFWSLALAVEAAKSKGPTWTPVIIPRKKGYLL